jgi:hypothetical protein
MPKATDPARCHSLVNAGAKAGRAPDKALIVRGHGPGTPTCRPVLPASPAKQRYFEVTVDEGRSAYVEGV